MHDEERRPIDADDLDRVRLLLEAFDYADQDGQPLWEALQEARGRRPDVGILLPDLVGNDLVTHELTRANLVLEVLAHTLRGVEGADNTIPIRDTEAAFVSQQPCPDCGELVSRGRCPIHEVLRIEDADPGDPT